jgi:hypothetical protein
VPADNQMINSDVTSFLGDPNAPLKILVLGNSITRHGPSEAIGWHFDWGMAASAPEKDYVHRLHTMLTESGKNVYMMIRQASHWERNFKDPACLNEYQNEKAFDADIVVFRLCENVVRENFPYLKEAIKDFLAYLTSSSTSVVLTTGFWKNENCDRAIIDAASEMGYPCVDIAQTDDSMMALGKFAHRGVSVHPGDEGMEMIAKKLFDAIIRLG